MVASMAAQMAVLTVGWLVEMMVLWMAVPRVARKVGLRVDKLAV